LLLSVLKDIFDPGTGISTSHLTIIGRCVPFFYYNALGLVFLSVVFKETRMGGKKRFFLDRVLIDLLS
jgi:hypothetical protein